MRGQYNNREDEIKALGWNNKLTFKDWSLMADLNYSNAKRNETYQEINTQLLTPAGAAQLDTMHLNWATGSFPTLSGGQNYSDASKLNLRNTIYGSGYGRKPRVEDTLKGIKLVASFTAPAAIDSVISDFEVGVNHSDRTKKKAQPEGNEDLIGSNAIVSSDLLYAPVNLGFAGSGTIPSFNVPGVIAKYYQPWNPSEVNSGAVQRKWDLTEKVTTTYAKANIDTQLGSMNVKGNFGVQIQNTDQSSTSVVHNSVSDTLVPFTDGKTYSDVLPSLNLGFDLGNEQTLRFAVAKQLARPRIDQMRASFEFHVDPSSRLPNANGGNPKLDPWRANALDLSYEKYFGKKAYVAVAGFYKKLTSYIYSQSNDYDFSKYTPGTIAITNIGRFSSEYNGQGGTLKGGELSVSMPFELLTPALNGFGILASTTYTKSDITIKSTTFDVGASIPLPGLSKNVTNLTFYYEKAGFSTRISQRRRSDFVGDIGNFAGDRNLRYVVGENITDFQIGYNFEEGTFKGLGLLLQVNNLSNAAYSTYQNTKDHPLEYIKYGRTLLMGGNYKF